MKKKITAKQRIDHLIDAVADKQKKDANKALDFLSSRNPLDEYWGQSQYVAKLTEYIKCKGEQAIIALAGFYLYAIKNYKGEKCTQMITSTFAHDLGQMHDEWMLPRSSAYADFFRKEFDK